MKRENKTLLWKCSVISPKKEKKELWRVWKLVSFFRMTTMPLQLLCNKYFGLGTPLCCINSPKDAADSTLDIKIRSGEKDNTLLSNLE